MSDIQYSNPEGEDGLYVFPHVELKYRREKLSNGTIYQLNLPPHLCGLESPTQNESIGILRYLALRLARLLNNFEDGGYEELGGGWYWIWKEETSLNDYLEIATAILAALEIDICSTSDLGHVTVELNPIIDEIEKFFIEDFIPLWHYMNTANPRNEDDEDHEEDFEYDFNDAVFTAKELSELYSFNFLYPHHRVINIDQIMLGDGVDPVEVIEKVDAAHPGNSASDAATPIERILQCIIEVLYFFKNSGEIAESNNYDINPEHMNSHEFLMEAVVLDSLGISEITSTERGTYRTVMKLGLQPTKFADDLGFSFQNFDPFEEMDPVDLITLGYYEYHFFTPDDPTELH